MDAVAFGDCHHASRRPAIARPSQSEHPQHHYRPRYEEALIASGLVDGIDDICALDPRPYRYTEGEYICRRGDQPTCLWIIVDGTVSVREGSNTLFVRGRHEVIGEQNLLGDGHHRWYDLIASEGNVELLRIDKHRLDSHPQNAQLWRNVAKIVSLKLKSASKRNAVLSHQVEDDTQILHAYTNEYALGRRMQLGGLKSTDYRTETAVIWFSDVANFSGYALTLAPERAADIVQRFFNEQSVPIERHGGYIDKFMGDGLMAFWIIQGDDELETVSQSALDAAQEAVAAVSNIRIGPTPLSLRVGLHLGPVLTGDFGSTTRHQFTLIGREVNKAARLEQIEGPDCIPPQESLGAIRLSCELRDRLSAEKQKEFGRRLKARAKHIGEVDVCVSTA